jgi:hypothetical protein
MGVSLMASRNSSFGYGTPTFVCGTCARRTRQTGVQGNIELCPECYELHGLQNSFWDDGSVVNDWLVREVAKLMKAVETKGGDMVKVRASLLDLLTGVAEYQKKAT